MSRRAVLFGSAPVADWSFLFPYLRPGDLIIAADGGLSAVERLGLIPDWYVGDNDSGGRPGTLPADLLPSEKDVTDLDMAVTRALREGAQELILCGCTGGREDHHLSAIGQLERLAHAGARGVIVDPWNEIRLLLPGETILPTEPAYHYFGLVPLDRALTDVSIQGAKYPASHVELLRQESLGISNEPLPGQICRITVGGGVGLLIRSQRR